MLITMDSLPAVALRSPPAACNSSAICLAVRVAVPWSMVAVRSSAEPRPVLGIGGEAAPHGQRIGNFGKARARHQPQRQSIGKLLRDDLGRLEGFQFAVGREILGQRLFLLRSGGWGSGKEEQKEQSQDSASH